MIKKPTKKQLNKKADALFSKKVCKKGICEMCGQKKFRLQCAHVVTRTLLSLRWDFKNALALCAGCHLRWHKDPLWAITWFKAVYPERAKYLLKKTEKKKKLAKT
jgi:5-methylcytosine-specific restriction endonuclease McrA